MLLNFNIGLLGHVDSGKTSLAKVLSNVQSTAAFDKNPQSKERGITLDLGFSALLVDPPPKLKQEMPSVEKLQITFVDCPGHASLIRTIIGGAQIIDLILLVIDAQKGIQTQTAECIVLGEILKRKLIVVVNKIDNWKDEERVDHLNKLHLRLQKTLAKTSFTGNVPIVDVSATKNMNIEELLQVLQDHAYAPRRVTHADTSLVMFVDHCFSIKGQGTICTGTIVQGQVAVNDNVEIPSIREQRKVKSIEMYRRPVREATMGDRVGICVTQFNAKAIERGVIASPGYLRDVYCICININAIDYYKFAIKSKSKMHLSVAHDTVIANVTIFRHSGGVARFDTDMEYEFVDEIDKANGDMGHTYFAMLEFERPVLIAKDTIVIASKLDLPVNSNYCRLAFWGHAQWLAYSINYKAEEFPMLKIFKPKERQGRVQRLIDEHYIIVDNLFNKDGSREPYIRKKVQLSTGESGIIESTFGQSAKVKVHFPDGLKAETIDAIKNHPRELIVHLKYKKFIFNKDANIVQ